MKGKLVLLMFVLLSLLSFFAFAQDGAVSGNLNMQGEMPADIFTGGFAGMMFGLIVVFLIIGLILYIYQAITLMTIANKTDTEHSWLAWIPVANFYLMTQIARVPWWVFLGILLVFIPYVGGLLVAILTVYLWWHISERRGFPNWFGILMIIPVVNLVLMGVIAWGKGTESPKTLNTSKEPPMNPDVARLRKYASDAMDAGKSMTQIKKELKDAGWSDDLIKKAF